MAWSVREAREASIRRDYDARTWAMAEQLLKVHSGVDAQEIAELGAKLCQRGQDGEGVIFWREVIENIDIQVSCMWSEG